MPELRLTIEARQVQEGDHLQLKQQYHPHAFTVNSVKTEGDRTEIDLTILKDCPHVACFHAREAVAVLRWESPVPEPKGAAKLQSIEDCNGFFKAHMSDGSRHILLNKRDVREWCKAANREDLIPEQF